MIQNLVLEYRLRKLEKVVGGSMPKYFYHGTSSALAKRILEDGLKPSKDSKIVVHDGLTNRNKVYLTSTLKLAKAWAEMANSKDYAVLQIDSSYLNPDLLEGDYNALLDLFDDSDPDPEDLERYANISFGDPDAPQDFEYAGSIPAKAISLVYQSDKDLIQTLNAHCKEGDYKWFVDNWNKYINTDIGTDSYQSLLRSAVSTAAGLPDTYKNNKLRSIVLSLPPKVLNYEYEDRYGDTRTVLTDLACGRYSCDEIGDIMADMADKFENTISDTNLNMLWKKFTKPKQAKNTDIIANLPERFLKIGKPFMSKKLIKDLGI